MISSKLKVKGLIGFDLDLILLGLHWYLAQSKLVRKQYTLEVHLEF